MSPDFRTLRAPQSRLAAINTRPYLRGAPESPVQLACIITSFNYADYIGRAIRSVIDQLDERCEIIVVDNASQDGSWDIIQSFGIAKTFRLDRNYGHRGACVRGFQHTLAPFILFLDSDDELAPFALSRILAALDTGVSKLQFPLIPIDSSNNVIGPSFPQLNDRRERYALIQKVQKSGSYQTPPTSGNILCRALCQLLADVDYEDAGDGISSLAAPFFGDVVSLSTPLGFYRVHGRNISQMGARPTGQSLNSLSHVFYQRLQHLSRIASERRQPFRLMQKDDYLYCRSCAFVREFLLQGPRFGTLTRLIACFITADLPVSRKIKEILYYLMIWMLPRSRAMALLDYRSRKAFRSPLNLIKSLVSGSVTT